jgi:bifunctional DNA-binding transcriptional regulator/antitoxin component of YhaV-PrlF toxin-antitoxin module
MHDIVLTVGSDGRVVFPASLRRQLGLKGRDRIFLVPDENGWRLETDADRRARMRKIMAPYLPTDGTVVSEEWVNERRAEAQREWDE